MPQFEGQERGKTSWTKKSFDMFPAGFEPATLRVWSARDNHYTTETSHDECCLIFRQMSLGPVAQRITRLTTDQKIAGSNPAWVVRQSFFVQ